jgi:tight adherence protein C
VVLRLIGALLGSIGVVGAFGALGTPRRALDDVLAVVDGSEVSGRAGSRVDSQNSDADWLRPHRVLGSALAGRLASTHLEGLLAADLAMTAMRFEDLVARSVLGAVAGFAVIPLGLAAGSIASARVPPAMPLWIGLLLGIVGVVSPVASLRARARTARRAARRAIGSFLDLIVLCLAGGMGIESALHAAAGISAQSVTRQLATALNVARDSGRPPWSAFDALGRRLGLDELVELAAALNLAGREGARIRATLTAKAAAMRRRELSAEESEANKATDRLFLPGVLLLVGFLVFIGYPAVTRILTGL